MWKTLFLLALASGAMRAEFLHIQVYIRDMSCESCTESLAAAFKKMRGVEKVDIDFKAGTVALDLAERNRVGLDQVWDSIKRVGFTPGESQVTVRGNVKSQKLDVPETGKTFELDGAAEDGENVTLKGITAPPPDPRTPVRIRALH